MTHPIRVVASLALATSLFAQATIVVGAGGVPEIRDALQQASAGDVLLVQPGTYAHFEADLAVTIRAAVPGTVDVAFDVAYLPPGCTFFCQLAQVTRLSPPMDQTLHVVGLRFVGNTWSASGLTQSHRVTAGGGRVTFDQCEFEATNAVALTVACQSLHLQGCEVRVQGFDSGSQALHQLQGEVSLTDCLLRGGSGPGGTLGVDPGPAIFVAAGQLHATGIDAIGGTAAFTNPGAPAVRAQSGSRVWISDSVVSGAPGSCAVSPGGATLRVDRTTIIDRSPNQCFGNPPPGFVLGMQRSGPPLEGSLFEVNCEAEPSGIVGVFYSLGLGEADLYPVLAHPMWLDVAQAQPAALLVADAAGAASVGWTLPTGPGVLGQEIWFQSIGGLPLAALTGPLPASGVVGGIVR